MALLIQSASSCSGFSDISQSPTSCIITPSSLNLCQTTASSNLSNHVIPINREQMIDTKISSTENNTPSKNDQSMDSAHENSIKHESQDGECIPVCPSSQNIHHDQYDKPICCRKLIHHLEKETTVHHSKVNDNLARKALHDPVVTRLSDKKVMKWYQDENLTFCPKLNPLSIKLAQERSLKIDQIQAKAAAIAAARVASFYSEYTFKPVVSEKSMQLVQSLDTGFLTRQQQHIKRRQKLMEETQFLPQQSSFVVSRQPIVRRIQKLTSTPSSSLKITVKSNTPPKGSLNMHNPTKQSEVVSLQKTEKRNRSQTAPSQSHQTEKSIANIEPSSFIQQGSNLKTYSSSPGKQLRLKKTPSKRQKPEVKEGTVDNGGRLHSYEGLLDKDFKRLNENEKVKRIKVMAEKVTRAKKVFMIKGGYKTVRKALRNRGWVELDYHSVKTTPKQKRDQRDSKDEEDDDDEMIEESDSEEEREDEDEYIMLTRAIRNCDPNFIWSLKRTEIPSKYLKKDQIVNHFSGAWFTTKFGLCSSLQTLNSFVAVDHRTFFPRCYRLSSEEDKEAFVDEYRLTTAMNMIKIVACEINNYYSKIYTPSDTQALPRVTITCSDPLITPPPPPQSHPSPSQTSLSVNQQNSTKHSQASSTTKLRKTCPIVPEEGLLLAIKACEGFQGCREHNDIDESQTMLCSRLTEDEWSSLISYYYTLVFSEGILMCSSHTAMRAEELLAQISEYHPQLSMDGIRNIWIIKPGALSRGRGIVCMDHLEEILQFVRPSVLKKENKWVVQKYIERPLLIHSTKFDIRQWFLVTDWNPLTMWMYQDCYLRFSSQLYSSEKLDTSIHLCNNSVQKHLENSQDRHEELPDDNMWDSDTFKTYLSEIGEGDKWVGEIYPGMRDAIIHVLQVSQDTIDDRKNTFELYGADFMITADFKPWLLEVNCSPTMERNTSVTKKLCKQVMEDTIKVVVDKKTEKNCKTGRFELAYKQPKFDLPPYLGMQLCVEGTSLSSQGNKYKTKRHKTQSIPAIDLSEQFDFNRFTR